MIRARRAIAVLCVGLLAAAAGCASPPPAKPLAAGLGGVKGKVDARPREGVKAARAADPNDPYAKADPGAKLERVDYARLSDIILWLDGAAPRMGASVSDLTLTPDGFSPAVVPAVVGGHLRLKNADRASRTICLVQDGQPFAFPIDPGNTVALLVTAAGPSEISCDERADVAATVFGCATQWFARVQSGQPYTFADVPPGPYKLRVWHARLPPGDVSVEVLPGRYREIDLTLSPATLAAQTKN